MNLDFILSMTSILLSSVPCPSYITTVTGKPLLLLLLQQLLLLKIQGSIVHSIFLLTEITGILIKIIINVIIIYCYPSRISSSSTQALMINDELFRHENHNNYFHSTKCRELTCGLSNALPEIGRL